MCRCEELIFFFFFLKTMRSHINKTSKSFQPLSLVRTPVCFLLAKRASKRSLEKRFGKDKGRMVASVVRF